MNMQSETHSPQLGVSQTPLPAAGSFNLSAKGFSIIEVLMGVTVFSLGLMGVLALLMSSVNNNAFASRLTEADFLANNQLERLLRAPWGAASLLDTDGDNAGMVDPNAPLGMQDIGGAADNSLLDQGRNGAFDIYWNNAPGAPHPNSTLINVIVVWQERGIERRINAVGVRIQQI